MSKKLFIVSDVHGFYAALMKALAEGGFDPDNEEHIFVSCGDLFDRGEDNLSVFSFVRGLERKILIKGNHDDNLYKALCSGFLTEADVENETCRTVTELLGDGAVGDDLCINTEGFAHRVGEIKGLIEGMVDYYETEKYVFTHGWLPLLFEGRYPHIDPDWRNASRDEWDFARWVEWQQTYEVGAMLPGKVIVCGHRSTTLGHMFDPMRANDCSDIFYGEGMIALDAGTVRSGRVNLLILDESEW